MITYILQKYGKIKVTFAISVIVSTITLLVTSIILSIFQGYVDLLGIVLSFGFPMIVTPIIVIVFSTLVLKLEVTQKNLKNKNIELENAHFEIIKLEQKNSVFAMVVTINHELNQPLQAITGYLSILNMLIKERGMTEKEEEKLAQINNSLYQISSIMKKYREAEIAGFEDYGLGEKMVSASIN